MDRSQYKYWTKLLFRALPVILLTLCCGCGTIRRAAVSQIGEALSSDSAMFVISSDNDPDLVWAAMPFALKTMEIMLAEDPSNTKLYLGAASGYITFASGNLSQQAQELETTNYQKAQNLWSRAYKLNLRGRDYALAALDLRYPGFSKNIHTNLQATLSQTTEDDVPFLFWAAVGWAGAISANKTDMNTIADLPIIEAMMKRVLKLSPNYNDGAVHEFFIAYEGGRPAASGGSIAQAEKHFKEAIKCTDGEKASPYVIFAETVAVKKQDPQLFEKLLNEALAIDVNKVKKWRLANTIAHKKALWLKTQTPELFFNYEENNKK